MHSFLLYQLLSKRIQRDLALIEALVQAPSHDSTKARSRPSAIPSAKKAKESDARVNPPVVKLLETVLQSLEHMRSLSIVDESPDLANAVDTRLAHANRPDYVLAWPLLVLDVSEAPELHQNEHCG